MKQTEKYQIFNLKKSAGNLILSTLLITAMLISPLFRSVSEAMDCPLIYKLYAFAVILGSEEKFTNILESYSECLISDRNSGFNMEETVKYLKAMKKIGDRVRVSTYNGKVKTHTLIVEASFAIVKNIKGAYITSLARPPEVQKKLLKAPTTRGVASVFSRHMMGLASDLSIIRRNRKTSMKTFAKRARKILRKKLGKTKSDMIKIISEPYCIHLEMDRRNSVGRREIKKRVKQLYAMGIIKRYKITPSVSDYVPERTWVSRNKQFTQLSMR